MSKEFDKSQNGSDAVSEPIMWIEEKLSKFDKHYHGLSRIVHSERTPYQQMVIADVGPYGRALFLDGCVQSSEGDEAFYHEPVVHVPCVAHGEPASVLVIGGGEGATAREALRWKSVTSVVNVELDQAVVDACRKYMPSLANGAFEDPRFKIVYDDAKHYLEECDDVFDVIICDVTDPMDHGPSAFLFTFEFFQSIHKHLSPSGTMVIQSGAMSLPDNGVNLCRVHSTLRKVFIDVNLLQLAVPKLGVPLSLFLATKGSLKLPSSEQLDTLFSEKLSGENRVLDGRAFHGLFGIPKCMSDALGHDEALLTAKDRMQYPGGPGVQ